MRFDRGAGFISSLWTIAWKAVRRRKGNLPKRLDDSKSGFWDAGIRCPVLSQQWSAISVEITLWKRQTMLFLWRFLLNPLKAETKGVESGLARFVVRSSLCS